MLRVKWSLLRLGVYVLGISTMLTFGIMMYLLAPISSYYLFGNLQIRKNHRYFIPFALSIWRTFFVWLTDKGYRDMFCLPLATAPRSAPDQTIIQLTNTWQDEAGDCGQCVRCCLKVKCPLLDHKTGFCLSYKTLHWRYFNCGRYPFTQKQIEYYACPKWELRV